MNCRSDLLLQLRMKETAAVGQANEEGDIELAMQTWGTNNIKVKIATDVRTIVVRFISVVGKIKDQGILVLIELDDFADNRIVIAGGIVIVCDLLCLLFCQLRSLIVAGMECLASLGETLVGINMLTHEMEEQQIKRVAFNCGSLLLELIDKSFVVGMLLTISMRKQAWFDSWIVEETCRCIPGCHVNSFYKLIAEESDVVTHVLEEGREQRNIAPFERVTDTGH